ncbi:hypothetical protein [Streptomyces sp. NPDC059828]|uniref:hypothetical protein n=1 Tax=Streptomyces sp. NPDC059828 TaxID=3346965 RepID=UPI00365EB052
MPDLWMPGATRLDIGDHAPTDGGPAKAIPHITWDRNATAIKPADLVPYENLVSYFGRNTAGMAAAPHILWDPFTGRFTQFHPANSRSKSLADSSGGTRTNRAGSVVIQIEAVFFPYCRVGGKVYARLVDTPCLGWERLHAWIKSWGVPDVWPMGRPTDFTPKRSESVWESKGGWYGHQHVPENDHQDPGSWPAFPVAPAPTTPTPAPAEEADVPHALNESNPIDVHLESGVWTPLAFEDEGAVLAGPIPAIDITAHLYLDTATSPDAKVQGQFYLTNADGSGASSYLAIDKRGGGGHQFVHSIPVPTGKKLWFQVRAISPDSKPVTLLHRAISGPYWTA